MNNLFSLEGKVAIVTGGGSGLGRSNAKAFAQAGANVVIADFNKENAQMVSEEIKKLGKQSFAIEVNVIHKADLQKMAEQTVQKFGKVDILLNSAGIGGSRDKGAIEMEEEVWDRVLDTNLKGTFLSSQAVAKYMIKQNKGRIINMASMSGSIVNRTITGLYGGAAYCASKAGVILLTKALALELVKYNINVNCISPGYMLTPLIRSSWETDHDGWKDRMSMTPMGRVGTEDELNGLAVYLASDSSSYMTGSDILIDGGYTSW